MNNQSTKRGEAIVEVLRSAGQAAAGGRSVCLLG